MSQASATSKLDAARKGRREAEQKLADAHPALPHIPALFLSYLATLAEEAYNPTRLSDELGVHVRGSVEKGGQRSNRAAAKELQRLQAILYREAERGMGNGAGQAGRIEALIYARNSTPTRMAS